MDNEACDLLKMTLLKKNIPYQLFPLNVYLLNTGKTVIQTFQDHFIVGLCSNNPKYPDQKLVRLIPQVTMNFNLLRTSHTNRKLSAHIVIFDIHGFNWFPLAPPKTKVNLNENTDNHQYWSPHGPVVCYIGPSMEHCICVKLFLESYIKCL